MQRTPCSDVPAFSLVLGARFCMDLLMRIREFFFRRFRASAFLGAILGSRASPSGILLELLGAGLGASSFSSVVRHSGQRTPFSWSRESGIHVLCSFLVSSARVGCLPPLFRLLPSLCLSLSALSLVHALVRSLMRSDYCNCQTFNTDFVQSVCPQPMLLTSSALCPVRPS